MRDLLFEVCQQVHMEWNCGTHLIPTDKYIDNIVVSHDDEKGLFWCNICRKMYTKKPILISHIGDNKCYETESQVSLYCHMCPNVFTNVSDLE